MRSQELIEPEVRFRILGPLRLRDASGQWRPIQATQQRVVLATLLAEAGRAVSVDQLIAEVWGERPPRSAMKTLHGYVFRLRRLLGGDEALATRDGGYALLAGEDDIDALVFERLVAAARQLLAGGQADVGAQQLARALRLWQGPALSDVPGGRLVSMRVAQLDGSKLDASEEMMHALLALGRSAEVAARAQRLLAEHPLRERLHELLILSLYRCGRRAEALEAYQRVRDTFVGELGIEPGPRLNQLHHSVLNDTVDSAGHGPRATAAPRVPAQLPADVAGFSGRDLDLKTLDELVGQDVNPKIVTIAGPPGVGKTGLAVHWAHQARHRFPDGQLYVNLRGYAASLPLRPIDALAGFLAALEVPAERIPLEVDAAAALYRSLLADLRVLVVLDNARDPDQVRPLLPAGRSCLVLVTSRDRLDGLVARDGAVRMVLNGLSPADAATLLARILGAQRVKAEPDAAARIAGWCDHLPLALRIAAANLAGEPHRCLEDYARRLGSDDRLAALEIDGDEHAGVRAAFRTSYATLPEPAQRLLRLLGLAPGPDLTGPAAAALAAIPTQEASRLLNRLCAVHLVTEHAPGRYALHDLLRVYSAGQAAVEETEDERRQALDRWYDDRLRTVDAAARILFPQVLRLELPEGNVTGAGFNDDSEALAWLDAERANLVAAIEYAAAHGSHPAAWRLSDALRGYLYLWEHTVDWRAVAEAALSAATADGEPAALMSAELSLAWLSYVRNQFLTAIEHAGRALRIAREIGWDAGESTALCNIGAAYWALGDAGNASDYHSSALAIDRRIHRVGGQATNLGNLGPIYAALGRLDLAAEHRIEAIALSHRIGSSRLEGVNLAGLSEIHLARGRLDEAAAAAASALGIFRSTGQTQNEPYPLCVLAAVHRDSGRHDEAIAHASAALALAREHQDRFREAGALATLGGIHQYAGRPDHAAECYRRALDLAGEVGDRLLRTEALTGLAVALLHLGKVTSAGAHARQALGLARTSGYRLLEADALAVLAEIYTERRDLDEAARHAEQADAIRAETGYRPRSHPSSDDLARMVGDTPERRVSSPPSAQDHGEWVTGSAC